MDGPLRGEMVDKIEKLQNDFDFKTCAPRSSRGPDSSRAQLKQRTSVTETKTGIIQCRESEQASEFNAAKADRSSEQALAGPAASPRARS